MKAFGPNLDRPDLEIFLVRRALISDIHGNLEALETVLEDIKAQKVDEIFCLGDIIGYGPNPCECVDLVMKHCKMTILGNHDQGAMFDPDGFNVSAERAIFWTRDQLENPSDRHNNEKRWEFLGMLPRTHRVENFMFVHGSPRNPLSEYVFPEDIFHHRKMERLFQLVERYCFQGHTHHPGVFTESFQFYAPEEIDHEYTLGDGKVIVNVGSVGQPRDGDPRSCYVILDDGATASGSDAETIGDRESLDSSSDSRSVADPGDSGRVTADPDTKEQPSLARAAIAGPARITFRRVPYDFEPTIQKIYAIPELDPFLGDRLRQGR